MNFDFLSVARFGVLWNAYDRRRAEGSAAPSLVEPERAGRIAWGLPSHPTRSWRGDWGLLLLAAGAICLVIVRACLQSVTIDEADSFILFAGQPWPAQWYPSSGNHVLNTLLQRLVMSIFGINELTLRTPAILGAIIYITAAVYLCRRLTARQVLAWPLFIALVYNPMVVDYLVAARGYSLASGFLLAALAVIASVILAGQLEAAVLRRECAWISVLLALSVTANFSFAIADALTLLFFFLWAVRSQESARRASARLAASCFLPGLAVGFLLAGSVVWDWPKGQLYFGSKSLSEMTRGLVSASFDQLNPDVLNPLLLKWLGKMQPALPVLGTLALLALVGSVELDRWRPPKPSVAPLLTFTRLLAGIAEATLLVHWIAFHTFQLLLPKDRTGLFFVILFTLIFGTALALRFESQRRDPVRWAGAAVLILVAAYFTGCLRLGYFREWRFDADAKQLYWATVDANRRCGIREFVTQWMYPGVLNFYKRSYGHAALEFLSDSSKPLPVDKAGYVLYYPENAGFIQSQGLKILSRGGRSDAVLAVRGCEAETRNAPPASP